jgi:maltooligosyltrehalose trehalohydrolase
MFGDMRRGATPLEDDRTHFAVWAPKAREVVVEVQCGGDVTRQRLEASGDGVYEAIVVGATPGSNYCYRLDGGPGRSDPLSRWLPNGIHGPSRVVVPSAFRWSDGGWHGLALADAIIYEIHIGTFTAGGTFESAIAQLPYLRRLGITAIELMPVAQFPGSRNWGYDGASLYAVQDSYGGPENLRRLVDAAHGEGLAVLLDVVYNHVGPEGCYLSEFGPYFSEWSRTRWGKSFNLDGADSDEVRRFIVGNALYWITEYHIDGLRLDAADRISDVSAVHILEELGEAVHAAGRELGRNVLVIAESDANDPRFVRPITTSGYGLDAQWSDDFHHAVHAILTGERHGYYSDFGSTAAIAKALSERFVNDGRHSPYRRRRHGRPATDLTGERFVVCMQNHDQIGNRAQGDRLSTLLSREALRLAAALALLPPYVPLLFMGEEYAETAPFLYFVDHTDAALLMAVREGRCRDFAGLAWTGEVPDPGETSSFERSRLGWERISEPSHAQMLALYRDLIAFRRTEPLLRPGAAPVHAVSDAPQRLVSMAIRCGNRRIAAHFNFWEEAVKVPLGEGDWRMRLTTDAAEYGGDGYAGLERGSARLAPRSAMVLTAGAE